MKQILHIVRKFALIASVIAAIIPRSLGQFTMVTWNGRGGALRIEWPTVGLITLCYGAWVAAGLFVWPTMPIVALAVMAVAIALQSSLMHEVLHGHPTRNAAINEAFIILPIGLVWPYRRFKALHLRHHRDERLTDPFDDPESFYQANWKYDRMPTFMRIILHLNNILLVRLVLGPVLGVGGLVWTDLAAIRAGNSRVLFAWLVHAFFAIPVVLAVVVVFEIPFWIYLIGPVWAGHAIIALRTFAEHQWSESADGRTIIVERSIFGILFLNNNLHFLHHRHPTVAWHKLPAMYAADREGWRRQNDGYVYPNYFALIRKFALRPKEPVVHPKWRRQVEQPHTFLPTGHGQNILEGARVAPVATPQKD